MWGITVALSGHLGLQSALYQTGVIVQSQLWHYLLCNNHASRCCWNGSGQIGTTVFGKGCSLAPVFLPASLRAHCALRVSHCDPKAIVLRRSVTTSMYLTPATPAIASATASSFLSQLNSETEENREPGSARESARVKQRQYRILGNEMKYRRQPLASPYTSIIIAAVKTATTIESA